MGMIRVIEKSKPKRKPGWQLKEAEYAAWMAKVNGMKTGFSTKPVRATKKPVETSPSTTVSTFRPASFAAFKGGGTLKVARPEQQYHDDPEMLARELAARQRKFNVAPAYNKGNDVFITEEELVRTLSSNKRRS